VVALSCGPAGAIPEPDELPYRATQVRNIAHPAISGDLDADGEDEIVYWYSPTQPAPPEMMAIVIQKHTGEAVEQVNFDGMVLEPLIRDVDRDGLPEILVPVVRNDSLFLTIVDGRGRKLRSFLVTTGEPRIEPEGTIQWDPRILDAFVTDTENDGRGELVLIVWTGYARLPRGVYVFALDSGRLEGHAVVGASLMKAILGDFDEDGLPEIVAVSAATRNGASAGGFDDSKAHLLFFELAPTPRVARSMELPVEWGFGQVAYQDFDADGQREILMTAASSSAPGGKGFLRLVEAAEWKTLRERSINDSFSSPIVIDLDHDTRPEIIALHAGNEIRVLNNRFELVRRRPLPGSPTLLTTAPDVDGDGVDEAIVIYNGVGTTLLDRDLSPKVMWLGSGVRAVVRRGLGTAPLLLIRGANGDFLARIDQNPFYLWHRYGPAGAAAAGMAMALLIMIVFLRLQRDNDRLRAVHAALDAAAPPALVVDRSGRVRWASPSLRTRLSGGNGDRPARRPPELEAFEPAAPGITAAVRRRIMESGADGTGAGNRSDKGGAFNIESVIVGVRGDPHWIVRVEQEAVGVPPGASRAWALMAQRIAHSLKNPLTSMLLTLQRLEMEYRERAPGVASRLDRYSSRLEERIEELRRLTSDFLKFVDLEKPELRAWSANALVREYAAALERTLPPDIRLDVRCRPELPSVLIDRDQIHAALENLLNNAVNAMPEGGLITLSTDLARGVQWAADQSGRDHVAIEVMDTGTGIPDELKPRLFEPGCSGREDGSGLGLAIVRKIVADHGGRISYESELGTGTAFTMLLPAEAATPHATTPDDGSDAIPAVQA
jgi:two-component sensor histidine kinase